MELEKTLKMNMLFSFYGRLLSPKQAEYMSYYYEDDYTLAEIADNYGVSRQAVYDSIKRAELALIDYEKKLNLIEEFENRKEAVKNIRFYIKENYDNDDELNRLIDDLIQDSMREENELDGL